MSIAAPESTPIWSPKRQRWSLGLLTLVYTLGFLDRQIINILAEPIKEDLGLVDWQLGALTGLAFALFYTIMGLPIARLADRKSRPRIIGASLFVWSGFTALCGQATGFTSLFLMRLGVGIGEAGCSPPATSLIADFAPKAKRASAMAFYALGNPLGSLLGLAFGGIVASQFGWRTAFLAAGLPGIIIAVIVVFGLREPRTQMAVPPAPPPLKQALQEIVTKRSFWLLGIGASLMAFIGYGKVAFYGSFFLRNHSDQLADGAAAFSNATGMTLPPLGFLGLMLGLLMGGSGMVGMIIGGRLADRAGRSDVRRYMTAPIWAGIAQIPFFVSALFVADFWLSLGLLCVPALLTTFWFGPVFAVIVGIVPERVRATCGASLQLVINIVGLGLGPLAVGLLSSVLSSDGAGGGESLRWAMAICSFAGLIASACFFLAREHIAREMIS